jgi:hypothetical protein
VIIKNKCTIAAQIKAPAIKKSGRKRTTAMPAATMVPWVNPFAASPKNISGLIEAAVIW